MKITSAVIMLSISLCASLCCSGEDDYYAPTIDITNDTIITVENNQNTFAIDDFIVIDATIFDNQVTESGAIVELSNYDYGEINQSFYQHDLALYKYTNFGTVVKIPLLIEHLNVINGEIIINNTTISIRSFFDGAQYRSTFGIQLLEAGEYFIADAHNDLNSVEINGGDSNLGFVKIRSKIVNSNTDGRYEFTVTE